MALTVNIVPTRSGTGPCAHLSIEGTVTLPNASTRVFVHRTDKSELMAPISDEDAAAWLRVTVRLMAAQIPNKTPAQIATSIAAKTLDLTVS